MPYLGRAPKRIARKGSEKISRMMREGGSDKDKGERGLNKLVSMSDAWGCE